ncbi:hypothetical protein [Streptomyces sp. NPDC048248]|uniref:hypothetical protein n=1 Tax=Streptomyces sp. NPDC048248 TaxID=3365523 RepID=UPI0037214FB8
MTAPAFLPSHVVPPEGMATWSAPDATRPLVPLDPLLPVQVVERRGDWALALCSNGWSAWVDGRLLLSVPHGPPAAGQPAARTADPRPLLGAVEGELSRYRRLIEELAAGRLDGESFGQRTRGMRVGVVVDGEAVWLYDARHERWCYCDGPSMETYAVSARPSTSPAPDDTGGASPSYGASGPYETSRSYEAPRSRGEAGAHGASGAGASTAGPPSAPEAQETTVLAPGETGADGRSAPQPAEAAYEATRVVRPDDFPPEATPALRPDTTPPEATRAVRPDELLPDATRTVRPEDLSHEASPIAPREETERAPARARTPEEQDPDETRAIQQGADRPGTPHPPPPDHPPTRPGDFG